MMLQWEALSESCQEIRSYPTGGGSLVLSFTILTGTPSPASNSRAENDLPEPDSPRNSIFLRGLLVVVVGGCWLRLLRGGFLLGADELLFVRSRLVAVALLGGGIRLLLVHVTGPLETSCCSLSRENGGSLDSLGCKALDGFAGQGDLCSESGLGELAQVVEQYDVEAVLVLPVLAGVGADPGVVVSIDGGGGLDEDLVEMGGN